MNNMNVMGRRMFENPNGPVRMQEGGMAPLMPPGAMMPPGGMPMPPPGGMMPQEGMMPPGPPMMPPGPPMMPQEEGVAGLMADQGIDPAMMEQMLASASENFGDLDSAQDFEQAMNAVRGDNLSIADRRGELAQYVGPDDANQTPASVLTLVQPVMMLAGVDEGIGGLAQGQMTEPVTGDMAQGIMSTVDMGGMQGDQPPVNFKQGGAVQRFAPENENRVAGASDFDMNRIKSLYEQQQALAQQLIPSTLSAEDLAQDKRLSEGQMMFDLANAGLQLAQAGPSGENFLGAVARAATDSQLFDKVGARAQQFRALERDARKERQAVDLMAFKSAQDLYGTERAYDAALAKARTTALDKPLGTLYNVRDGAGKVIETGVPLSRREYTQMKTDFPRYTIEAVEVRTDFGTKSTESTIRYLTSEDNLSGYANGTLGDQKVEFEQVVLDYLDTGKQVYNTALGKYVQSQPDLAPQILQALKTGDPEFYNRVIKKTGGAVETDRAVKTGGAVKTNEAGSEKTSTLNEATIEMFNADGSINYNSEVWSRTKPPRFNPDLDYGAVVGLSRILPGVATGVSEFKQEITGGTLTPAARDYNEARSDLAALANDMLKISTNDDNGRILKAVQDLLIEEQADLRPGGILRGDAAALATLTQIKESLAQGIMKAASVLPRYGGVSDHNSAAAINKEELVMNKLKNHMNEVLAFEKAFKSNFSNVRNTVTERNEETTRAKPVVKRSAAQQILDLVPDANRGPEKKKPILDDPEAPPQTLEGLINSGIEATGSLLSPSMITRISNIETNASEPISVRTTKSSGHDAHGIMQIKTTTAVQPGSGFNIFDAADTFKIKYDADLKANAIKSVASNSSKGIYKPVTGPEGEEIKRLLKIPELNTLLGISYLNYLSKRFGGDEEKIVLAYNQGMGTIRKWDGNRASLNDEGQNYIRKFEKAE